MKIKSVQSGSIASAHPIQPGNELLEINGHPISDVIDYRFYSSDPALSLKLKNKKGRTKKIKLRKAPDQDLGLEFCQIRYKSCRNNCIFCFVHQLPKGMRKSLYFKDEDYRLSFLHGNFITLTNLSNADIDRIIEQRLTPLYVSVHTTDHNLRKKIFRNPKMPEVMPIIKRLAKDGIEMHTQIVLCPGINDGEYLERSVGELAAFYPRVKSLALVPVGLTRHRRNLPRITPIDKRYSSNIVKLVNRWQKTFRNKFKAGFVYASDEFFIKGELDIPKKRYYDDFDQIENGVGMMRKFLDQFQAKQKLLPQSLSTKLGMTLITGVSAFRLIREVVRDRLSIIPGLGIKIVAVRNDFFGPSVTVTGLLTGVDIVETLRKQRKTGDLILLPPNCINQDRLFLDNMTPQDMENRLGRKVIIGSYDLVDTVNKIAREWRSRQQWRSEN
jgi:putative radical SAM enzyme (TIGR03279 family)